jgi:uncharacterized protein (DUF736 family)
MMQPENVTRCARPLGTQEKNVRLRSICFLAVRRSARLPDQGNEIVMVAVSLTLKRRYDMAIIGNFTFDKKKNTYTGDIVTLSFEKRGVMFIPTEKSGDKEPDYRVTVGTEAGPVELGAAWKRTSERGQDFVSVALDGPLLAAPFNAALFPDKDGNASLVWNRPKKKAKTA